MQVHLPAARLSQYGIEKVMTNGFALRQRVRTYSPALTEQGKAAGLPAPIAEVCGGLLATAIEDVVQVSRLPRRDFERTKRLARILEAGNEPQSWGLKLAMAFSPVNGRALVAHWDVVCEPEDKGRLAWLLGMDTENGWRYGKRYHERTGL